MMCLESQKQQTGEQKVKSQRNLHSYENESRSPRYGLLFLRQSLSQFLSIHVPSFHRQHMLCAAPAKRVKNKVSSYRGHFDHAVKYFCRKRVGPPVARFKLPMSHWWNVSPHVFQRDAIGIHRIAVPSVIFNFTGAVPTGLDGGSNTLECLRFAFGVVEQAVMAWMEPPWNRETCRYLDSDPVSKVHPKLSEICSEKNVPFRQVVERKRPLALLLEHTRRSTICTTEDMLHQASDHCNSSRIPYPN